MTTHPPGESRPGQPGFRGSRPSRGAGKWNWYALALVLLLIGVTLGPALLTSRVFLATDIIATRPPFSSTAAVPAGLPLHNVCIGDTVDTIFPSRELIAQSARSGEFAQWNPYGSGGAASGALPSYGLATPYGLMYLLLPQEMAPEFAKLVEMVLAVLGMTLLLRRWGARTASGVVAGLAYTTSGFLVVWTNWPQSGLAAMLPFAFWAVEVLLASRTVRSAVPLSVVVSLLLFGGFPAVTGYLLYALVPYTLVRLWNLGDGRRTPTGALSRLPGALRPTGALRSMAGLGLLTAAAVVLGIALSAFELLPFAKSLLTLDLSARAAGPDAHLPFSALATAVWPNLLGGCSGNVLDGRYFGYASQVETSTYVGAATLVLAVIGAARPGRGRVPRGIRGYFVGAVVVASLLVFRGGFLLGLAQHLPVFSNNPVGRLRVIVGLAVCVLAGLGTDALMRRPATVLPPLAAARRLGPRLLLLACVPAVSLVVVALSARQANQLAATVSAQNPELVLNRGILGPVLLGLVALLACAVAWWGRPRAVRVVATCIPPLLVVAQGAAFASGFWVTTPERLFYPSSTVVAYLQAHSHGDRYAAQAGTLPNGTETKFELRSVVGHTFVQPAWADLLKTVDPKVFATPTYAQLVGGLADVRSPVLDRMGTKYFVTPEDTPVEGLTVPGPAADGRTVLSQDHPVVAPLPVTDGLRAVVVTPLLPVYAGEDAPKATLTVQVEAADGTVLLTAGRRLQVGIGPPRYQVPVAGEGLAGRTGLRVRMTLSQAPGLQVPLAAAGGTATVGAVAVPPGGDGLSLVLAGEAVVYQRQSALPRVRWAGSDVVVPQPQSRIDLLASGALPAGTVVLAAPGRPATGSTADVIVTAQTEDRTDVSVDAGGAGYLVVADSLTPGFTATVDGAAAPLVSADHAMQGVWVPAGRHHVTITYSSPGLHLGIAVSGVALLLIAGILVVGALQRRGRTRRGVPTPG